MHTEEVAIFATPPINTAVERISWEQFPPTVVTQQGSKSRQFYIPGSMSEYIDLARTELYMSIRVEKEDGTSFKVDKTHNEIGLPIDMIFHSMWKSVDVKLNNILVSSSGTDYPYKAAIETLLNYNRNAKVIQLSAIGYTGDERNPAATNDKEIPINHGLRIRKELFGKIGSDKVTISRDKNVSCEFMGNLLADICNQEHAILNNVNVTITLTPSKDEFRLIGNTKCRLIIEDIYLDVCKVGVTPALLLAHEAGLEISPSKYPFQKVDCRSILFPARSNGDSITNIYNGVVPSKLIVAMVDSDAYSGDMSKNPLNFEHFDVESIGFFVNTTPTPKKPYEFNFEENIYLDGLLSLYRSSGKVGENTDLGITREMYKNGMFLVSFDVDPTAAADMRYLGVPQEGHTKLTIKFKKHLTNPIYVILYATFPSRVEIDKARVVRVLETQDLIQELQNRKI